MKIDWQPLCKIIASHKSFLLTSHCRADCDAIGSELAMAEILDSFGKQVRIVNGDEVPNHIRFFDPENRVETLGKGVTAAELADLEVLMVVDTSAWVQLGPMAEVVKNFSGVRVVVDHHVSQDDMQATVFKDSTAEATGRLVLEFCEALDVPLTPTLAQILFTAIATDTGWFRFSLSHRANISRPGQIGRRGGQSAGRFCRPLRAAYPGTALASGADSRPTSSRSPVVG